MPLLYPTESRRGHHLAAIDRIVEPPHSCGLTRCLLMHLIHLTHVSVITYLNKVQSAGYLFQNTLTFKLNCQLFKSSDMNKRFNVIFIPGTVCEIVKSKFGKLRVILMAMCPNILSTFCTFITLICAVVVPQVGASSLC